MMVMRCDDNDEYFYCNLFRAEQRVALHLQIAASKPASKCNSSTVIIKQGNLW